MVNRFFCRLKESKTTSQRDSQVTWNKMNRMQQQEALCEHSMCLFTRFYSTPKEFNSSEIFLKNISKLSRISIIEILLRFLRTRTGRECLSQAESILNEGQKSIVRAAFHPIFENFLCASEHSERMLQWDLNWDTSKAKQPFKFSAWLYELPVKGFLEWWTHLSLTFSFMTSCASKGRH